MLYPYPPNPEYAPWSIGQDVASREETKYNFLNTEALVAYFSQWLEHDYILSLVAHEKQVFVVRKEVSLEETRLQFLKKCENSLLKILTEIQNGRSQDWGYRSQ